MLLSRAAKISRCDTKEDVDPHKKVVTAEDYEIIPKKYSLRVRKSIDFAPELSDEELDEKVLVSLLADNEEVMDFSPE